MKRSRAGLTFLELLLAVAISGLILTASSQLLFSMAHFWQQSELEPRFAHHVDGVTAFIQYCFDESAGISGSSDRQFGWRSPPEKHGQAFQFRLNAAPPFFVTETYPPPAVDAWLVFEESQGLSLLWHIPAALTDGKIKLHRTPVSGWVEDVEIGYYDAARNLWEYESYAKTGSSKSAVPQGLRILFNQNGCRQTRYIRMQRHDLHVLVY